VILNLDFRFTGLSVIDALDILFAQLSRDLFAIVKFLLIIVVVIIKPQ